MRRVADYQLPHGGRDEGLDPRRDVDRLPGDVPAHARRQVPDRHQDLGRRGLDAREWRGLARRQSVRGADVLRRVPHGADGGEHGHAHRRQALVRPAGRDAAQGPRRVVVGGRALHGAAGLRPPRRRDERQGLLLGDERHVVGHVRVPLGRERGPHVPRRHAPQRVLGARQRLGDRRHGARAAVPARRRSRSAPATSRCWARWRRR